MRCEQLKQSLSEAFQKTVLVAEEMAQHFRQLSRLSEDSGSVPSTPL